MAEVSALENVLSFDGIKKSAALYIDTVEKLANEAIDSYVKFAEATNGIPAPLLETQASIGRKWIELSTRAARDLWQIRSDTANQ